jgi:hypothetical protein
MAILGLIGSESLSTYRFKNIRRSVFYDYPNGVAPLTGLLTLQEEESTNDQQFFWWEKRLKQQRTLTITQGGAKGPFLTAAGADLGDAGPGATMVVQTNYRVNVTSSAQFRVGHVIRIPVTCEAATVNDTVFGVINQIVSATIIQFQCLKGMNVASLNRVDNGTGGAGENVGVEVLAVGSAAQEGQVGAGLAVYNPPVQIGNYTQIFRTAFQITGSALKTSLKYDETGAYKDQAKEASLDHMRGMEFAQLFGEKTVNIDPVTNLPTYTTGGLLYFLKQWELGSGYEVDASSLDTDDGKRIITNSKGYVTEKEFDNYLERVFRVTNNKSNEKLILCGSGALNTVNRMYKGKSVLQAVDKVDSYGMNVTMQVTPFGTVYYKTHPLFNQNPTLRFNMLFIEIGNLRYRYLDGRDTELLDERQPNNADYKESEWITEAGLEVEKPESMMYIQNMQDWAP